MMVCRFHSWKLDHFSVFVCGLRTELRLYDGSKVFFAHIFALSINGSCSYQCCSPLPRTASTAVNTPAAFPFSISTRVLTSSRQLLACDWQEIRRTTARTTDFKTPIRNALMHKTCAMIYELRYHMHNTDAEVMIAICHRVSRDERVANLSL